MVYVVGERGRRFHRHAGCWRIRQGQATGTPAEVFEVPLNELVRTAPCRACYPRSPRAKLFRPYCHECASVLPCQHNGGIKVRIPRMWDRGTRALIDPGEVTFATRYVWPDRAYRYKPD